MPECPENSYNATSSHVSACEGAIDPMGGGSIPEGYTAVELFINGRVEWQTDPSSDELCLPVLLLNQANGGILIDEGIYLSIDTTCTEFGWNALTQPWDFYTEDWDSYT